MVPPFRRESWNILYDLTFLDCQPSCHHLAFGYKSHKTSTTCSAMSESSEPATFRIHFTDEQLVALVKAVSLRAALVCTNTANEKLFRDRSKRKDIPTEEEILFLDNSLDDPGLLALANTVTTAKTLLYTALASVTDHEVELTM